MNVRTVGKRRGRSAGVISALAHHPLLSWRRLATAAAAALTVALGYHVVFGQNGLTAYEHKRQESTSLGRESLALQRENDFLRGHVARLTSDPSAIEHQAREELHYARPGEVIYTLPTAPGASATQ